MSTSVEFQETKALLAPRMAERNAGFWCPDGWLPLVLRLDTQLCLIDPTFRIVEVKEKFGRLRFNVDHWNGEMRRLIMQAEETSISTCQNCGSPEASSVDMGAVATLCDACLHSDDYHRRGY